MNYNDIATCCRYLLLNFPGAKDVEIYIDKRISKISQEKFQFGYFPPHNNLTVLLSMTGDEKLSTLDLIYDKIIQDGVSAKKIKCSPLENHNMIIPFKDLYGNTIALVGRTILSEEQRKQTDLPKYRNTSFNKGNHLFGLFEAKHSIINNNIVYVVEGQFDCIKASDKGLLNIVALGSSNMTFEQFALLNRYTDNIVLLLDNDEAGKAGGKRIIELYSKYANIKNGNIPNGYKDVDEYLGENDVASLVQIVK